ncbi:MAG TPA: VWA domain-containing protein [Terriglobia bacterium]|nr:VWA domain-containing protein [Terriglobia bacterium]
MTGFSQRGRGRTVWLLHLTAVAFGIVVAVSSRLPGPFGAGCIASSVLLAQSAPKDSPADPSKAANTSPAGAANAAADGAPTNKDKQGAQVIIRQPSIHTTPILVDVNLVVVNITVTDPYDRIVTGLDQSNFEVYDDKVPQQIAAFSTEDAPISVGLVFDSSGSMSDKIEKSKEAALQFFKTSNPQDEFMLVNFNERPDLVSSFTSKFENLQDRLILVKAGGKTALLDAIYLAITEMKKATTNRKALLVISDGGDNHSRYTERDIRKAVKESDVEIFAVGVFEAAASRGRTPEEAGGPGLLSELSEVSGGRMFSVEDVNELPDIMEKISIELRNQYVIGYKPSNLVRDGRWRRIKVKLNPPRGLPPLQVYARTGYYAPTQ